MIERSRRTDENPWKRVHDPRLPQLQSRKYSLARAFSPPRLWKRGQSNVEKSPLQTLSQIDGDLNEYVRAVTREAGMIPADLERMVDFGIEVFVLSEGCAIDSSLIALVWRHSLRTGYLAALIALSQRASHRMIWQSFVGGVLHDIGMVIFLIQQPQVFPSIVNMAQYRGWDLHLVERQLLGSTHAENGATFLARWDVDEMLLATVACHDDPMKSPCSAFGPWTAVYAANLVEGGGMAQDGDGIIGGEGEAYLTRLGLWDDLPLWQGWMRSIHQLAIP